MNEATRTHTLTKEAKDYLKKVSTATLTSQLLKRGFRNTFIKSLIPLRPDLRMVGYAFTLRYIPAREDLDMEVDYDNEKNVQRLAVEALGPEDVLVIDARGDTRAASFGHILATRILSRGAAGLVSDGALRDTPAFKRLNLSVYVRAAHATTSSVLHHPVDMNTPIGCGGVMVMPADVIVGDAEGVVVIPSSIAESVAHGAYKQELLEEFILRKVEAGASLKGTYPPDESTLAEFDAWRRQDGHQPEANNPEGGR